MAGKAAAGRGAARARACPLTDCQRLRLSVHGERQRSERAGNAEQGASRGATLRESPADSQRVPEDEQPPACRLTVPEQVAHA
eukprot:3819653-Lingulodinium_polyedra.AAC.1